MRDDPYLNLSCAEKRVLCGTNQFNDPCIFVRLPLPTKIFNAVDRQIFEFRINWVGFQNELAQLKPAFSVAFVVAGLFGLPFAGARYNR